ncbi:unnamed protein product [Rhodiola kirilowii]
MPTIFNRFFHLYNLLYTFFLPKNLKSFLPPLLHSTPPKPPSSSSSSSSSMDRVELKRVFQMFDRNGDGRITTKELSDSLENLGIFIPDNDLTQMIEKIDVNGDGCVDIDEFGDLYQSLMDDQRNDDNVDDDMKEAFNVFDQNGDGFITVDELRSVLASLGINQGRTVEDCKMMISKVDADGDGRVSYKEFSEMMRGGGFSALG